MYLTRRVDNIGVGDDVAESPARDRIGLGQGRAAYSTLSHIRERRKVDVLVGLVDNVLIHLVGDNECVVLFGEVCDYLQLIIGKYLAAGIGRVTEYYSLGVLLECRFKLVHVEVELGRIEWHIDRLCVGEDRVCAVVFIEGREYDDFIPGVCDGHHCRHHSFGASAGNNYLTVWVDIESHKTRLLFSKRFTKILSAPCN